MSVCCGLFCAEPECTRVLYKCEILPHLYSKSPCAITGQMLINWFVSAFPEEHYLRFLLTSQDLRILAAQFSTHLLAAGVLRQIPDKEVQLESLFRVSSGLSSLNISVQHLYLLLGNLKTAFRRGSATLVLLQCKFRTFMS